MRWREIEITYNKVDSHIFSQIKGNIPLLKSADVGTVKSHTEIDIFAIAPHLQRLKLRNFSPLRLDLGTFPWSQLAHLDIGTDLAPAFHDMLVSASGLSFLKVDLYDISSSEFETITNATISTLHLSNHFKRVNNSKDPIKNFLNRLMLPALRNLRIKGNVAPSLEMHVISFISRSACNLSFLNIRMFAMPDFVELMQLMPTLQELSVTLQDIPEWDGLVECLTLPHGLHLVPNLRSLAIRWPSGTRHIFIPLDNFADMVDSRWTPKGTGIYTTFICAPLSHVQVYRCDSERLFGSSPALVRLRRFSEEGLNVTLLTKGNPPRDLLWNQPHTI